MDAETRNPTNSPAPAPLRLRLLGGFGLTGAAGGIPVPTKKNRALLAILVLSPGQQSTREKLCGLLWGDRAEDQARSSLRQSLAMLRKELGEAHAAALVTADDRVGLDPALVTSDVTEFRRLSDTGGHAAAAALYGGEFLADTPLREEAFNDWLAAERRALADRAIGVFEALTASGSEADRVGHGKKLLSLDPLREASHRALMEAHAASGDRAQALKQFEACRDILRKELGVEPSARTVDLSKRIAGSAGAPRAGNPLAAEPPPPPAGKPSIAVLPFTSLGGGPEQQYLADGVAEDIITGLARFRQLAVVARNSSFRFRGDVDLAAAARDLKAEYIVEGSVRRIGDRLRITAQLIHSPANTHVWANSYDVAGADLFDVQDQVARTIVATLGGRVVDASVHHAKLKPPGSLAAYELVLRANALDWERPAAMAEARQLLEEALRHDPNYATAHSLLAAVTLREAAYHGLLTMAVLDVALAHARTAVAIDANDSACHSILGWVLIARGEFGLAAEIIRQALQLNPNNAYAMINQGGLLNQTGYPDEAIVWFERVERSDPYFHPSWRREKLGFAHFTARRYAEAVEHLSRAAKLHFHMHALAAACHAKLGKPDAARAALTRALELRPDCTVEIILPLLPYERAEDRAHLVEALRLAGVPENGRDGRHAAAERPAIAVVPFVSIGDMGGHDFLATGLSDDLAHGLSRFAEIEVVRGAGSAPNAGTFVLTGSVRAAGNRLRVAVELADSTGRVAWSQRHDREMGDMFAIQDEIVEACVYNLVNAVNARTLEGLRKSRSAAISAYQLFLEGRNLAYRFDKASAAKAGELLSQAVHLDPDFAAAHAWLAELAWISWWGGWTDNKQESLDQAVRHARLAVDLDGGDQHGLAELGQALTSRGEFREARLVLERAMALNPNNPDFLVILAYHQLYDGETQTARETVERAMSLDPSGHYGLVLGIVLYVQGDWAGSVAALRLVRARMPAVQAWLAAALAMAGESSKAREIAEQFLRDWRESGDRPEPSTLILDRNPFRLGGDIELIREGLKRAGFSASLAGQ